jgi:hypothetical protein
MSRYTKQINRNESNETTVLFDTTITYGFDHVTGYFFEVFQGETKDGEDVLAIEECSTFTGMSNGRMIELMEKYRVDEEHIKGVALDLPI